MKKFFVLQSILLFTGMIFAWTTVANDYMRFTQKLAVNPLTTPCFYGALGFAFAYFFSIYIIFTRKQVKTLQKYLIIFLIAGTLFGWTNFIIELCRFYIFNNPTTCSGAIGSNPFFTPCFYGACIYLLSLLSALITYGKLRRNKNKSIY